MHYRVERRYGEFIRSFNVRYGVLTVTLPKNEEARPKQISVKVH
jgi:HSP20 family molecular chaperone IbpA